MTTDFCALCAELVRAWDVTSDFDYNDFGNSVKSIVNRARAALADGPAVPESREPASVVQEPSDAELVGKLVEAANGCAALGWDHHAQRILRAAELLQRLASPACMVLKPSPELIEALEDGPPGRVEPLLEWLHPTPVPVSERPWEREGWCDVEGRFWAEHISRSGVASWRCAAASDLGGWAVRCLPAHALPLPEVGE